MTCEATIEGRLPPGVNAGLITPLHKGGGRSLLNYWRPMTLLNTPYKILAKTLQIRLQLILMEVVSPDQSAFLPMRYILHNIFLTKGMVSNGLRLGYVFPLTWRKPTTETE